MSLEQMVPTIVVRPLVILAEVRELLADQHPEYAAFLAEQFDEIVTAVETFAARLSGLVERSLSMASEAFAGLAAAMFTAVDQLSSASLRGYMKEQSDSVHDREWSRDELAELLLSDRSDSAAVRRAAAACAGWVLPDEVAVVLVDPDNEVGRNLLAQLGGPMGIGLAPD